MAVKNARLLLIVSLVFSLGRPAARAADDPSETLIRKGIELRKAGDDEAARIQFQKAYEARASARAAAQLGLAEFAVGRWAESSGHLSEALRASGDPWVVKNRAVLEESLRSVRQHVGRVEILGQPAGAEIAVNGRSVGRLPLGESVAVNAGMVDVAAHADGFKPMSQKVQVSAGGTQSVVFRLEAVETSLSASTPPGDPGALSLRSTAPNTGDGDAPSSTDGSGSILRKPWFWGAVGAAVIGAVVIGVLATRSTEYPAVQGGTDYQ